MTFQEFLTLAHKLDKKTITVVHNGLMANGTYLLPKNGASHNLIELTDVDFFRNGYALVCNEHCDKYSILAENIENIIIE